MPHRVFSIEEVASYLHLDEDDVRTLVRDGAVSYTHLTLPTILRV